MSRHYYVIQTVFNTHVFSNVKKARSFAEHAEHAGDVTLWEFFDNGWSGAMLVYKNGKALSPPTFRHNFKAEPFTLLKHALIHTPNGKLPEGLRRHIDE